MSNKIEIKEEINVAGVSRGLIRVKLTITKEFYDKYKGGAIYLIDGNVFKYVPYNEKSRFDKKIGLSRGNYFRILIGNNYDSSNIELNRFTLKQIDGITDDGRNVFNMDIYGTLTNKNTQEYFNRVKIALKLMSDNL